MKVLLFFLAFLSGFWLFVLVLYWAFTPMLMKERDAARKKYSEYVSKKGLVNAGDRFLFAVFHAYVLFPIRGLLVALTLISIFILFKG